MNRYVAIHPGTDLTLDWDEDKMRQMTNTTPFQTGHYVHIVDNANGLCVACGMPIGIIRSHQDFRCQGPQSLAHGWSQPPAHNHSIQPSPVYPGGGSPYLGGGGGGYAQAQQAQSNSVGIVRVKVPPPPEKAPEKEKLIAESAKPTTGIDWEAFKTFGRGL